jgi:hypothetical protein
MKNEMEYIPFDDVEGDTYQKDNIKTEFVGAALTVLAILGWCAVFYSYNV